MSDIAIKVQDLSKVYNLYDDPVDRLKESLHPFRKKYHRDFYALNDVTLEIKKGETVGIIGRNGSGKSTLLKVLTGVLTPTVGQVIVQGKVLALLELGAGFNPELSGIENIYFNGILMGATREEIDGKLKDILSFADIGDFVYQSVKSYSSGMYVRLAFAIIAHLDADILVIDEALAVGDAFFTQKCMRYLRNFMKTGTVIFVSHDTHSVRSLCTRAIWLEAGKILDQGSPKEVCESYLEAFYEQQQGKSTTTKIKAKSSSDTTVVIKDQRQEFINSSTLRNDIQIFDFDQEAPSFGQGAAQITDVKFLNNNGDPLAWIVGGEEVILKVEVLVNQVLDSPIIGFFIKDKLGQGLFGDNTFLSYLDTPVCCASGQYLKAKFSFQMPRLAAGDYSITVAIANGTQMDHIQHHWVHDAIFFKSESTSVAAGLIGIPMHKITLEAETDN